MQATDDSQKWFLMKHEDSTVFGPVAFAQLREWALDAQISPLDKVSTDESSWFKAPMVPELEMDYLIEVSPDQFYGPTTLGAVSEFLTMGEISLDTGVINCRDGSRTTVQEIVPSAPAVVAEPEARSEEQQPVRTSIRVSLQQRIRELEEALMEERRAHDALEMRCEKLEAKLAEFSAQV